MKIRRVIIENYRSIERVELNDLGDYVVLYGPNSAGKTNILRGIGCAVGLLGHMAVDGLLQVMDSPPWLTDIFQRSDFHLGTRHAAFEVEVAFADEASANIEGVGQFTWLRFRFAIDSAGGDALWVSTVAVVGGLADHAEVWDIAKNIQEMARYLNGGVPRPDLNLAGSSAYWERLKRESVRNTYGALRVLLVDVVAQGAFHRIDDVRGFSQLSTRPTLPLTGQSTIDIERLLRAGQVEEAVSRAATSGDDFFRERFDQLGVLLTSPPLNLPDIEAVVPNGRYCLRVRSSLSKRATVDSAAASLGVQQVIFLLGVLLFGRARAYAIEEPEAHLHAPTAGRALRQVLYDLVKERKIDQLFIATHSNLFDLDHEGYWSVRNDGKGTNAEYVRELSRIDQDHLYEPGAAKRVLQDLLRIEAGDRVVATGKDGPITARQMLLELQEDTETGVRYAVELSRAAARRFLRSPPDLSTKE